MNEFKVSRNALKKYLKMTEEEVENISCINVTKENRILDNFINMIYKMLLDHIPLEYVIEYTIIPIKHLNTICNYFNISIDYIFGFTKNIHYYDMKKEIDRKKAGSRLKAFRKEKGLTQVKLSEILNVSQSTIAEYERGTNIIATPFLYEICKKYNISADYLLGRMDNPKYLK